MDSWVKKCSLLEKKCEEYEEINNILLVRTRKIQSTIERTEREKRFLVKRLEQFEVIDEVPKINVLLNPDVIMDAGNERALLATAVKIRAEVNSELARLKSLGEITKHELKVMHVPNTAHRRSSYSGNGGNIFRAPTSAPHGRAMATSIQSPVTSVIVTPTSAPPPPLAVASAVGATKLKKGKPGKVQPQVVLATSSGKLKSRVGSKRKRPDADPNAPKKPSNAFFWFCQEKRASLQEKFRGEGMSGQHDLTKALAKLWSETGTDDKKKYYNRYTIDKARYDKEMENYSLMKQGQPVATQLEL